MTKWLELAAGVFLFFNGMRSRTYGYSNPAKYCWNMEQIHMYGCFASPEGPLSLVWKTTVLEAALNAGCELLERNKAS